MKLRLSQIVFAAHWLVALVGHLFLIIMPVGLFRLLFENDTLDLWVKGFLLGVMYMSGIYAVNHVTNSEGFCVLTSLENACRKREGLPPVPKRFVPRFYVKCADMGKWVIGKLFCKKLSKSEG